MRVGSILALGLIIICQCAKAQQKCSSFEYRQQALLADPALNSKVSEIEAFIKQKQAEASFQRQHLPLITIPVVIHVLYNNADQNLSDQIITKQLAMLNSCFRRLNYDSVNTPSRFQSIAADCDIEFKLAITDPQRKPTTGIIRKYTNVTKWMSDDKMKFASSGGDDAWDSNNYLNLWICNLGWIQGYASFPGGDAAKDGIVMNYDAFRWQKTTVHEAGHWLGLRHIWGDDYCGDDLVDDTPKQGSPSNGCPTGFRSTCNNGELGDMYMNYMDVTSSDCVNLFTEGQKKRMRAVLDPGGARNSLLSSYALLPPTNNEIPVPEDKPVEKPAVITTTNVFPNPAIAEVTIDVSNNVSWIGNTVQITSAQGVSLLQAKLTAKTTTVNISSLKPGVYFITAKKEDGASIKLKLMKM